MYMYMYTDIYIYIFMYPYLYLYVYLNLNLNLYSSSRLPPLPFAGTVCSRALTLSGSVQCVCKWITRNTLPPLPTPHSRVNH